MYLKSRAKPYKLSQYYSTMLFLQPFLQWIKDASQFNTAHYVPNTEIFVVMKINFMLIWTAYIECHLHFVIFRLSGYDCIKYFVGSNFIIKDHDYTVCHIHVYLMNFLGSLSLSLPLWEEMLYNKIIYFIAQCYHIEYKIHEIVKLCQRRN